MLTLPAFALGQHGERTLVHGVQDLTDGFRSLGYLQRAAHMCAFASNALCQHGERALAHDAGHVVRAIVHSV